MTRDSDSRLREAVEADPWSFKEGTLRERLEWARVQHQVWAEACNRVRPADGRPPARRTYAEEADWHFACARWYEQMVRDLDQLTVRTEEDEPERPERCAYAMGSDRDWCVVHESKWTDGRTCSLVDLQHRSREDAL